MDEKSKHQSALDALTINFTPFLKAFMINAHIEVSEKAEYHQSFLKFMHLAILSSAQRLYHLKERLSKETSDDKHESYKILKEPSGVSSVEPKMTLALEIFKDALPQYLKNIMFQSGFHITEIEETHPSYVSLYSSFIVSQTEYLDRLKSNIQPREIIQTNEIMSYQPNSSSHSECTSVVIDHNDTNPPIQKGSCNESKKTHIDTIELIEKTRKHCIYRDYCRNVAIKVPVSEVPSVKEVEHLENEFKITKLIVHPAFRLSLAKSIFESRKALTLEWAHGYPISDMSDKNSFSVKDFLEIAREIVSVLLAMHTKHIMHMNLTCDHIIFNPESRSVKIIGCGSSANFNSKGRCISNQELFEKDLRYISPEQTGRVNREVDFRSDFYSLGVVFYKLLTGKYPFENKNTLKYVHLHIFQEPLPVCSINNNIPIPISMMISTLMKKNAEDRYQSAKGLIYDLDLMISEYETNKNLISIVLAQNDMPQTLLIPQKLYGRSKEYKALFSVIDKTNLSSFELVFVTGRSGTGKSALIFELNKSIIGRNGVFICGKYDRKMSEPYSAILEAMNNLCNDLLVMDEAIVSKFKTQIKDAIGQEGKILTDVISNLHLIIGRQSSASDTYGQDAKNQFNYVFIKFIKAICSVGPPIVLVLEDLHWMDFESLDLLSALIKDKSIKNLVLIGTYRDNEVNETHPVSSLLQNVISLSINRTSINLGNLNHETVNELISHTVCLSPLDTYSLTVVVHEKTKGNPFFVNLMLKSLFEHDLLFFCSNNNKWRWNLSVSVSIENKITENVLELLRLKILALDEHTQQTLKVASCLGSPFSLTTLKLIVNSNKGIEGALNTEIITQYKGSDTVYRFAHDQIQQAAYSLLPNNAKELFLYIGKKLWRLSSNKEIDEIIFVVANLLHNAVDIVTSEEERLEMANIFLQAGEKAMLSTAFKEAFTYLQTGIKLLGSESFKTHYDLALKLYDATAKAAFSAGKITEMNTSMDTISENVASALHLVNTFSLKIKFYNDKRMFEDAICTARIILDKLGESICFVSLTESELQRTKGLIIGKSNEEICAMKTMENEVSNATARILNEIICTCYFAKPELTVPVTTRIVQLTFEHGTSKFSSFGFCSLGLVLCSKGEIVVGFRFGVLGLKLAEKHEAKELLPWILMCFYTWINPYYYSYHDSIDPFYRSFKIGLEVGSLYICTVSASNCICFGLISGVELNKLARHCQEFNEVLPLKGLMYSAMYQAILNLVSVDNYDVLSGEEFDFECCLDDSEKPYDLARALVICCMYAYLFSDYPLASVFLNNFRPLSGYISFNSGFIHPISIFYDGLISLAAAISDDKKEMLIDQVKVNISKLRDLSENAPMNHLNKVYFLEAEMAVVNGDVSQAITHYEEAISLSKKYGLINEEAMACERAGMLYLNLNSSSAASQFLLKSYRCYDDWGAKAKMHQLIKRYPEIFAGLKKSLPMDFTGLGLEKESQSSVSLMSESETSIFPSVGKLCTSKRKRT